MKNIISVKDLTAEDIRKIFLHSENINNISSKRFTKNQLKPKVTLFFKEPSTRTRGSFNEAARRLNFDRYEIIGEETTSLAKKESLADTVRMLGKENQNADILVMRMGIEGAPRFVAEIFAKDFQKTAVINAGDGTNQHPTQALLDFFTIASHFGKKNIPNLTIGFMGDLESSRVAHSNLELARLMGVKKIRLVSMPEAKIQPKYKDGFNEVIESGKIEALSDCDVIIALRVQAERITDKAKLAMIKGQFRITPQNINVFKKEAIIMHPLPNPKDFGEIDPCLYYYRIGPRVIAHQQSIMGIPVRMALLELLYKQTDATHFEKIKSGVELKKIREESAEECLKRQRNKSAKYYNPILGVGVIIDHLPKGEGIIVQKLFEQAVGKDILPILPIKGVNSTKYGMKDVVLMEGNCLALENQDFLATIALKYENITLHLIKDGMYKKFKLNPPAIVRKLLSCKNPDCVTNHEPEAITCFYNKFPELGIVECAYCEREFAAEDLKPI